jgi:putative transposase
VKYTLIESLEKDYPLAILCEVLKAPRSGYYQWRKHEPTVRAVEDTLLLGAIRTHFVASHETYGSRRILADLRDPAKGEHGGFVVNHKHVERLMRDNGLMPHTAKRFRGLSRRAPGYTAAPNLLQQHFVAERPDQRWLVDSTQFMTDEGKLYLAVVEDLFSRRIVGWQVGMRFDTLLVAAALTNALQWRRPQVTPETALIHHSDQGTQYTSADYQQLLANHKLTPSMSDTGNCYDNAPMESFISSIKKEWTYPFPYASRRQLTNDLFDYIEIFYNRQRRHSALGYLSPCAFEDAYTLHQQQQQQQLRLKVEQQPLPRTEPVTRPPV